MTTLIFAFCTLLLYMSVLFLFATYRKNNGIADIGYGIGCIVTVIATTILTPPHMWPLYLLIGCVTIWGIRLGTRIYYKNRNKPEDFRYKAWRDTWGKWFLLRSFFQIYILQGTIIFIVVLPITLSIIFPLSSPHYTMLALGLMLWIIGFLFESIADLQLDLFLHNPLNKGKILTQGLWKYSRHPNYFGESLMWWGLALAALGLTSASLLVFLSPIVITFLLLKVSGVPMLEARMKGNSEWEIYRAKTSVFFPLPPR